MSVSNHPAASSGGIQDGTGHAVMRLGLIVADVVLIEIEVDVAVYRQGGKHFVVDLLVRHEMTYIGSTVSLRRLAEGQGGRHQARLFILQAVGDAAALGEIQMRVVGGKEVGGQQIEVETLGLPAVEAFEELGLGNGLHLQLEAGGLEVALDEALGQLVQPAAFRLEPVEGQSFQTLVCFAVAHLAGARDKGLALGVEDVACILQQGLGLVQVHAIVHQRQGIKGGKSLAVQAGQVDDLVDPCGPGGCPVAKAIVAIDGPAVALGVFLGKDRRIHTMGKRLAHCLVRGGAVLGIEGKIRIAAAGIGLRFNAGKLLGACNGVAINKLVQDVDGFVFQAVQGVLAGCLDEAEGGNAGLLAPVVPKEMGLISKSAVPAAAS